MDQASTEVPTKSPYGAITSAQRVFFDGGDTLPYRFRKAQLDKLETALRAREDDIAQALASDLGKSRGEAYLTEIAVVNGELAKAKTNLKEWMRPRRRATPLGLEPSRSRIYPMPKGVTLIVAPWNYPFQLLMVPLISAMAAGNTVILKPSEEAPATAEAVASLLASCFDPKYITVVQGLGHEVVPRLMKDFAFNHVFFTGSPAVGRKIAEMAAVHLAPITLELGGKSPAVVDESADISTTARRLVWGKFTNAGQTCVSPDYLLVKEQVKLPLVEAMQTAISAFYGKDPKSGNQYARMVNRRRFDAVVGYLSEGRVLYGGHTDPEALYISPTLMDEVTEGAKLMEQEIFGPVLPIFTYESKEDLLEFVRKNRYPLSLYYFGKDKHMQNFLIDRIEFGGGCVNNTLIHFGNPELPLGGVQHSGSGHYHGQYGFACFSHLKSIVKTGTWLDPSIKYPPYTRRKIRWLRRILG